MCQELSLMGHYVLNVREMSLHLTLYYQTHFTDEETEAQVPQLDLQPALSASQGSALSQPAPQPPSRLEGSFLSAPFPAWPLK